MFSCNTPDNAFVLLTEGPDNDVSEGHQLPYLGSISCLSSLSPSVGNVLSIMTLQYYEVLLRRDIYRHSK